MVRLRKLAMVWAVALFAGLPIDSRAEDNQLPIEVVPQIGHASAVVAVAFSPDGTRLVPGGWDNTVKLWDVSSGQLLRTLEGHLNRVSAIAFSPNGTQIVSASNEKALKLWDAATGRLLQTLEDESKGVTSVAFAPSGKLMLRAAGMER